MQKNSVRSVDISPWDLGSYGILLLFTAFQILQWPLLPRFLDIYYHLNVVKGFADAGGYVSMAFWEYAPTGRPHLYPPLLHSILLLFYKAGVPIMTIGRGVDCISYPALLFSFYYVMSRLYTKRFAFISLLMLSSVYSVLLASVTLSTFNLAIIFTLFSFLHAEKNKTAASGLCLALCFYTHALVAWPSLFSLFLYGVIKPERRAMLLKVTAISLVLALPFLALQFQHRASFAFADVYETKLWEVDLTVWALALCGLLPCLLNRRCEGKQVALALFFGFLPLAFSHPPRYLSGHGMIGALLLAAHFADDLFQKAAEKNGKNRAWTAAPILAGVFLFVLAPIWEWNIPEQKQKIVWGERTLTRCLFFGADRSFRTNSFCIYFPEKYQELVDAIKANSEPDDILWSDFSYAAGILGLLSDRAVSCAMLSEVKPLEKRNALRDAKILVWFKDGDGGPTPQMHDAIQKLNLSVLKETEMAFVLLNPDGYTKSVRSRALIPTVFLEGLLAFAFISLWFVSRTKPKTS